MKTWLMGFSEFLLRYKLVWSETWKIRKQLDTPVREKDENEFLPAHLELIETRYPDGRVWLLILLWGFWLLLSFYLF